MLLASDSYKHQDRIAVIRSHYRGQPHRCELLNELVEAGERLLLIWTSSADMSICQKDSSRTCVGEAKIDHIVYTHVTLRTRRMARGGRSHREAVCR